MKKMFTMLVAIVMVATTAFAERVSETDAALVANNFMNVKSSAAGTKKAPSKRMVIKKAPAQQENQFYVYENENGEGWVMVSASDKITPILAFSETGHFRTDNMPQNLSNWLGKYNKFVQKVESDGVEASAETTAQWEQIKRGAVRATQATIVVGPLVKTTWDQDKPYYNLCPGSGTTKAYTGCVATAMAQVMNYWQWPIQGTGSHSYQPLDPNSETGAKSKRYSTQSADFSATTYDWDNMLNSYSGSYTTAQATAVATLMYHCGVATEMMYGIDADGGSGTYTGNYGDEEDHACAQNALWMNFGYKKESIKSYMRDGYTTYYQKWSDDDWTAMVKAELDLQHPIMYGGASSGGGHSFICDGYRSDDYFHFNWGWSGTNDGYYKLSSLIPGGGGAGGGSYDFSEDQDVIIGIVPDKPEVAVESITLNPSALTLKQNEKQTVVATVLPANAQQTVTWTSSNTAVATVANGVVKGIAQGTATITVAATDDSGITATCVVTVTSEVVQQTELSIDFEKEATEYEEWVFENMVTMQTHSKVSAHGGDYFGTNDSKANATVTTKEVIAAPETISFYISKQTPNANAASWLIQVSEDGDSWTEVKKIDAANVTLGSWSEVSEDLTAYTNVYVRIAYSGNTATRCIDDVLLTMVSSSAPVVVCTLTGIELDTESVKKAFVENDEFSSEGLKVTATYSDCESREVKNFAVTEPDMTTAGEKLVTVSYTENDVTKTATYQVVVSEPQKYTITWNDRGTETEVEYIEGEKLQMPVAPADCSETKVFVGWTAQTTVDGDKPADLFTETTATVLADATYFAVFATKEVQTGSAAVDVVDEITLVVTGASGNTYSSWSNVTLTSSAVYAGCNAGGNQSIQLRSNKSDAGIITTATGGKLKKVVVTWNENTTDNRKVDVYAKNEAYTAVSDLYNSSKQGTKVGSAVVNESTTIDVEGDYAYVALRSNSGALYLDKIEIIWTIEAEGEVVTYSDYTLKCSDEPATYTVTWVNYDGTVLEVDENVSEGTDPEYNGAEPQKPEDEEYTYSFSGWSPELESVAGDVTYTAQFTPASKEPQTQLQVIVVGGEILSNELIHVYDLMGKDVTRYNGTLTAGAYLVKTADRVVKVLVK